MVLYYFVQILKKVFNCETQNGQKLYKKSAENYLGAMKKQPHSIGGNRPYAKTMTTDKYTDVVTGYEYNSLTLMALKMLLVNLVNKQAMTVTFETLEAGG